MLDSLFAHSWIWWTFSIVYALTIVSIIAVIISENRNPVKSLAWVTVLMVVPLVGLVLYVFFGRNIQSKRILSRRNRRRLRRLAATAAVSSDHVALSDEGQRQVKLAQALTGTAFYSGNSAEIFNNGIDKFNALLADIEGARHFINLQYYIIEDDAIGSRVLDALMERARAGVKVRIIYDHVGSFKLSRRRLRALREAGVEAYPFFKVAFPPFGTRINWRNHRKIVVVDGRVGYIGGMNIADRYLTGGRHFSHWRDLHLRITGPAVAALQQSFATDWNFMGQPLPDDPFPEAATPQLPASAGNTPSARPAEQSAAHNLGMQLVIGGPVNQWMNITLMYQQAIARARACVYIITPYFLPSESLLHTLQIAALAKVDVRVMLPRKSDSRMLQWASFSYVNECLQAGIKFYLYTPGMLHSKAIIVDDDFATVGSANFDFRSFEHNFEANMMIYSPEFNARMKELFFADQRKCERIRPACWRRRPILQRAMESIMRLFAPIL